MYLILNQFKAGEPIVLKKAILTESPSSSEDV